MPKLSSAIDPKSETFLANAAANRALNDESPFRSGAALGGPDASRARHVARGKKHPRLALQIITQS
jgi:3-methylcrotonyl-CoA carboxylase beta subunit